MISPDYHHYIITRFNLKQEDWQSDKSNKKLLVTDPVWLEGRFKLFETYCLPSVKAQTCKNFKWLVYFDIDTPQLFKSRIALYQNDFENYSPRFIAGMDSFKYSIKDDIARDSGGGLIITTRLDNDDAIHETFIAKVQFKIQTRNILQGVIDIPNGYCLQLQPEIRLLKSVQHSNAFITYVEPFTLTSELKTVMNQGHGAWLFAVKTYILRKDRLWLQVIHENNVINVAQGIFTTEAKALEGFGLSVTLPVGNLTSKNNDLNSFVEALNYRFKKAVKKCSLMLRIFSR